MQMLPVRASQKPMVAVFDLVTSVGGVQTVMALLLPRLERAFHVVVLDPYDNPDYARLLKSAGVARRTLGPAPSRKFVGGKSWIGRLILLAAKGPWLVITGFRLRRWVARHRPAALYFNQPSAARFFSWFLPAKGPPLFYHAHGSVSGADLRDAAAISARFAKILAVSERTKICLVQAGADPKKVSVVYNGVDGDDIRRRAVAGLAPIPARAEGEIVIVLAAVLAPNKCQDLAVEALAKLPPNVSLWLCGAVPRGGETAYRDRLAARVAALGLSSRVHFLGWRDDVAFVMSQADICLLPSNSHSETFGMVLVEAMTLAKPCVGTAVGGIPEVIADERTGLVVPNGDPGSLAAALGRLAASSELRLRMGLAGQDRAAREFTLARQAIRIEDEIHRAILR